MSSVMKYETDGAIAIVLINHPPVNALSHSVRAGIVEGIDRAEADRAIKAVAILCEGRTFFAGADISEFGKPMQEPSLRAVLERIERCAKPVIAGLHGTALGGGFETALASHYRVAVPSAKVGLPEVALGLLPGAGGTQRLPRLVGPQIALDMMTGGKPIAAQSALDHGVLDLLAREDHLREDVLSFARRIVSEGAQLRRVRDRDDKIAPYRGKPAFFVAYRAANAKAFRGFKAPLNIIKTVEAAVELPFDAGMARERELFEDLYVSREAAAQRYVFFAERQAAKIPDIAADGPTRAIRKVGVLGAGTMGGGIAMNFLSIGMPVIIVEQTQEALDRGVGVIRRNYEASAKKGRISPADVDKTMALLTPSVNFSALAEADLIIEAVFEMMDVKREVFARLDQVAKERAILATNTSYLDINEIAASTTRAEDVIGMHFFSPANVMPLLEVVRAEQSAPDAINTAMQLAKRIGKTAVCSRVGYGFIANRVMTVRGRNANRMALEGVSPADIDRVIYDYGFAMGPFQMMDLVGLDVIGRGSNEKTASSELVRRGRLGQKQNGGYYDYDAARNPTLSPIALEIIREVASETGVAPVAADDAEILARLLYPVINEGAKVLEEGIALRASDIDTACIKGYNWPVYRGGPMFWADTIGLSAVVSALDNFATRFGSAFAPAPLLQKLAREGGSLSEAEGAAYRK
jgi:3-hydroxyacyl-CoA dehydrogenase